MADRVRKVNYCYVKVPNRTGQAEALLGALREANGNLLAFSGFPVKGGASQLDMITDRVGPIRGIAKKLHLLVSTPKKGFLIQGQDEIGAVHRHIQKLAAERINVTAADAVCAGRGRYGMILWVRPSQYTPAAKALRAQ